jgi:para-aminobenzoate synthetase/4-amino-4-deoxychorismate lyase
MNGDILIYEPSARRWLRFAAPREVVSASALDDVVPALERVERAVNEDGRWAAGFVAYEAAPAFDPVLAAHASGGGVPLLWFGIYDAPADAPAEAPARADTEAAEWESTVSREDYGAAIRRIKQHLADGDTYQVNFTFRLRSRSAGFNGDANAARAYFDALARGAAADYAAFVDTGRLAVCSASPELFFRLDGNTLECRPMKGTAPRALTPTSDRAEAARLRYSEKERAENVMIVDMIRNDMGRVAETGSVKAPVLFRIEKYPTVWQMTSTVTAETRASVCDIIRAMFPCASVTGAPRRRTMEIIRDLETTPRGVYTGSIGFIAPGRRAQFNVAIRTVVIDREEYGAEYGVGGGIVWDSTDEGEFEECRMKAEVLTRHWPEFSLLETMRWTPGEGHFLLRHHLERLARSADYFDVRFDERAVREALAAVDGAFALVPQRVRILLARDGRVTCEATPLETAGETARVAVADAPIDSRDLFLYHKTTHRAVYERALAAHPGCDDVILWNERGEITEACNANVVVEIDGRRCTPPVTCGLLAGTCRQWLLENNRVEERVITRAEFDEAPRVWLVNSVRGERVAVVETAAPRVLTDTAP